MGGGEGGGEGEDENGKLGFGVNSFTLRLVIEGMIVYGCAMSSLILVYIYFGEAFVESGLVGVMV